MRIVKRENKNICKKKTTHVSSRKKLNNRLVCRVVNEFYFQVRIQGGGNFFKFGSLEIVTTHFVCEVLLCLLRSFGKLFHLHIVSFYAAHSNIFCYIHI
nr:MAG TPA_asm: hypothetical protein [Caudoviricetes sp.]